MNTAAIQGMATYRVPSVRVQLVRDGSYSAPRGVRGPRDLANVARAACGDDDRESLLVFGLDARNRVVSMHRAAVGTGGACLMGRPEILRAVLLMGVSVFAVSHNHPSGDPAPSADDRTGTAALADGARAVGLTLIDHVIIGEADSFYSFCDHGLL